MQLRRRRSNCSRLFAPERSTIGTEVTFGNGSPVQTTDLPVQLRRYPGSTQGWLGGIVSKVLVPARLMRSTRFTMSNRGIIQAVHPKRPGERRWTDAWHFVNIGRGDRSSANATTPGQRP